MLRITSIALHLVVGILAVGAGQALALQPNGAALGFPVDWLEGSLFPDYRFPGLFLAIVIGGANLMSAVVLARRASLGPAFSLATGVLLIAWVSIETMIIGYVHWSQIFWVALFGTMTVLASFRARDDPTLATLRIRVPQVIGSPRLAYPVALGLLGTLLAVYLIALHPWLMNWGATPEEQRMTLSGDDAATGPGDSFTRAISIQATPSEVWPWLLQIGQDRAGFYSNTWLENLFTGDIHNASQIKPEWQQRAVGDKIPMAGAQGTALLGDSSKLTVRILEPERVIGDMPGRFVLLPQADGTTRLLLREPLDIPERAGLFGLLVWDPMHFVMEQRLLRGIKERVEGVPLVPVPLQVLARVGWLGAGLIVMGYFVSRRRWLPGLLAPAAVVAPTLALTGDYDAALAGGLAVGITILGALAFGREWWPWFLPLAATILLVLLLAPDGYTAFGFIFLFVSLLAGFGLPRRLSRWRRPDVPTLLARRADVTGKVA